MLNALINILHKMISCFEQTVLLSVFLVNGGSILSHAPKSYFIKKFAGRMQKYAERALHSLISLNYVRVQITGSEKTYALTQLGLDTCWDLMQSHCRIELGCTPLLTRPLINYNV
jgi:hypothetical protein